MMRSRLCLFLPVCTFMTSAVWWTTDEPLLAGAFLVYEIASWVAMVEVPVRLS